MYMGRRSRYNEVVPICAMEAERLSGGIAPLLPKLGCRWMCGVRRCALANLDQRNTSGVHWVGGWVGAGVGLDVLEKR